MHIKVCFEPLCLTIDSIYSHLAIETKQAFYSEVHIDLSYLRLFSFILIPEKPQNKFLIFFFTFCKFVCIIISAFKGT